MANLAEVSTEVAECVARDNPLVGLLGGMAEGEFGAWRLSDRVSGLAFGDSQLFTVGFRPFGVRWQLALGLRCGACVVAMGVNRDVDFSDEELRVGRSLAAHLRHGLRAVERREALATGVTGSGRRSGLERVAGSARLTAREAEVLHWIAEGKRNGEIARILGVSAATVKRHCENLYAKLEVETRGAAVAQVFAH